MQSLAICGYTADNVNAALHSSNRRISFRYDLLDKNNVFKKALSNMNAASVAYDSESQIKRTAKFTLLDDGSINFLSDRIKPWVRLRMQDGGFAEWPQGVFLLSTPPRKTDGRIVIREVEAYDLLKVLVDDKVTSRYTVSAGTNYITAVQTLLTGAGLTAQNLTATTLTLPTAMDWDPGTDKLTIINALLDAINYRSLWIDENGIAVAQPYVSPSVRASEYTYQDDDESVIFPDMTDTLDLFNIPNSWTLIVSEPDRPPLVSTYTNTNANSQTSTVSRGRTIVDYRQEQNAADQATLDAKVQRLAFEASQVFEEVEFYSAIMPFHSDSDVLTLISSKLSLNDKYSEIGWSFDFKAGSRMAHKVRRVVAV